MKKILITIIACVWLAQYGYSQKFNNIENVLDSLIRHKHVPSIGVAILKEGKIIYETALGYADVENKIKATVHTPYQLASLTKPITATAIMKLHEQGIIDIDDPITKYIPLKLRKVEVDFSTPSIRQVLNHTSGLGTYFDIYYEDEKVVFENFEKAWDRYGTLFHEPGEVCEYSNLGYGLLDYIIAKNSSMSFADYLKSEIFNPLGMQNSSVILKNSSNSKEMAKKYNHLMEPLPFITNNTAGAGNVASSVHDIMRFANFHLENLKKERILGGALIKEMQCYKDSLALYHYYKDTYYGLGWYVNPNDNGQSVVWHEGGMMGASTMLKLYPNENIAIVLVTNTYNPGLCRELTDRITVELIEGYRPTPINETAEYGLMSSDSTFIGKWEGYMMIEEQKIPVSLSIADEEIRLRYIDYSISSFLTGYQPIPYTSSLLFGAINRNRFIGTGVGKLPASNLRRKFSQLLTIKLLKNKNQLTGTITTLAAADREYYAYPYYLYLEKTIPNK